VGQNGKFVKTAVWSIDFRAYKRDKRSRKSPTLLAVGIDASFVTASAQQPARTEVREDDSLR
jgi:hypothetical protein